MVPKIRLEDEIAQSLAGLDEITRPIHNLRILEARVTCWSAIGLLGLGTIVLVIGALGSDMHAARLAAGALLNLIGGAILKLHKDMHAKLERFHRDRDQMHMVLQIQDKYARDRAIEECSRYLRHDRVVWWKRLLGI
jgi:uncharacterized membrane protein YraQ (UPF0718 family)